MSDENDIKIAVLETRMDNSETLVSETQRAVISIKERLDKTNGAIPHMAEDIKNIKNDIREVADSLSKKTSDMATRLENKTIEIASKLELKTTEIAARLETKTSEIARQLENKSRDEATSSTKLNIVWTIVAFIGSAIGLLIVNRFWSGK